MFDYPPEVCAQINASFTEALKLVIDGISQLNDPNLHCLDLKNLRKVNRIAASKPTSPFVLSTLMKVLRDVLPLVQDTQIEEQAHRAMEPGLTKMVAHKFGIAPEQSDLVQLGVLQIVVVTNPTVD